MPIYEYGCAKCGETFEVWQSMSDAPVQKCEKCGSKRVSRLISQSSFQLKGGGWYASGYARKGKGDDATPATADKVDKKVDVAGEGSGPKPKGESKSEPVKNAAE